MDFRLLGPVEVWAATGRVPTGQPQQRLVLAVLLAEAGRPVPVETLIDRVWGDAPPRGARQALHGHLSRIRQSLPGATVSFTANCYLLDVGESTVDLHVFRELAGPAPADRKQRADRLRRAMGLWRGEPLAGLSGTWVDNCRQAWRQQYLDVAVAWAGAELVAGDPGRPIEVLTDLVERFPTTEPVAAALIRSLAAAGRPADALIQYDRIRRLLSDELGTDPSHDLQAAFQGILRSDSPPSVVLATGRDADPVAELEELVDQFPLQERLRTQLMLALYRRGRQGDALAEFHRARSAGMDPGPDLQALYRHLLTDAMAAPIPLDRPVNALPRAVRDFTGRTGLVRQMLASAEAAGPGPHVEVIDGMAGIGKTTLAVHVAGLLRERFPDAQLFVDLQGHTEEGRVDPAAALLTLLLQLGVPGNRIPKDLTERSMLWRTELSRRRAVLILDNARSTAQVSPLLPGEGPVLTLITSRRRLVGLDGVRPESMRVLADDEAIALLASIAGDRVGREPEAAAEVVHRCGGLPLAIRLAGARLAHRPRWRVAELARRLRDSALPELAAEDRTVAGAFAVSYSQLSERGQRVFRLLGAQPIRTIGILSVAALTGLPVEEVQDQLDEMIDLHLIEEPETRRYRFHDLVHEFAGTLSHQDDGERRTALSELIDLHLHTSNALTLPIEPWVPASERPQHPARRPELLAAAVDDPAWFENQRPYLADLITAAAALGEARNAWVLARGCWRFMIIAGYNDDIITVMHRGREVATAAGDQAGIEAMLNCLASGYHRTGQDTEAEKCIRRALDYAIASGNRLREAIYWSNLHSILLWQGETAEALASADQSYELLLKLNQDQLLTSKLGDLTHTFLLMGRNADALAVARRHLQSVVEQKQQYMIARALMLVGCARLRLGAVAPAERILAAALRRAQLSGYRVCEAETRCELGRIAGEQGRFAAAMEHILAARQLMLDQGDQRGVASTSNELGMTLRAMGDLVGAAEAHRNALSLARRSGYVYEEGRALSGIAACIADDDPERARRLLRQALVIFERMGVPERFDVRRRLGEPARETAP